MNPEVSGGADRDGDLLSRALDGDERAWIRLVDRYASLVHRAARSVGLPDEDAEDVSQSVWITLVEKGDAIRNGDALPAWLAITARRTALKWKRGQRVTVVPLPDEIEDESRSVEELIAEEETLRRVRMAVRGLPERCRRLFGALFREKRPDYHAVARQLEIPIGSIGPTRARCLARLERILRQTGTWS